MPLPAPEPGLVICYEFLWGYEADAGHDTDMKRRPCAIVVASETRKGQVCVTVAPITHREPRHPAEAILIPPRVKAHLGLDAQASWVVLNQLNRFVWPGLDLHPVPGGRPGQFDYGFLPPRLFERIRQGILTLDAGIRRVVDRND